MACAGTPTHPTKVAEGITNAGKPSRLGSASARVALARAPTGLDLVSSAKDQCAALPQKQQNPGNVRRVILYGRAQTGA